MKFRDVFCSVLLAFVFLFTGTVGGFAQISGENVITARNEKETLLWNGWKDSYAKTLDKGSIIVDPFSGNVFSEAMAHALILAVQFSDQEFFNSILDGLYAYFKNQNGLFAWKIKADGRQFPKDEFKISASETEINVLFALLQAQQLVKDGTWKPEKQYMDLAVKLESALWKHEVFKTGDSFLLLPSDEKNNPYWPFLKKGKHIAALAWAPTYFNPAYCKVFAAYFPDRGWAKLTDLSYELVDNILYNSKGLLENDLGVAGLNPVPAWIYVDLDKNGAVAGFGNYFKGQQYEGARYSNEYDSIRVPVYVGLDWIWNEDKRALDFMERFVEISQVKRISQAFSGASPEHAKGFCDPLATGSYGVANFVVNKKRGGYFFKSLDRRISPERKSFGRDPEYSQYYYNQTLCLYAYLILNGRFEKIL